MSLTLVCLGLSVCRRSSAAPLPQAQRSQPVSANGSSALALSIHLLESSANMSAPSPARVLRRMEQLAAHLVDELMAIRRENQPQQPQLQSEQLKVEGAEKETQVKQQPVAKEEHGNEAATAAAAASSASSPSSVRPPRRRRGRRRVKAKDTVIIQYEVRATCRKLKAARR